LPPAPTQPIRSFSPLPGVRGRGFPIAGNAATPADASAE